MTKALEAFTITPSDEGYLIRLEDEDGEVVELVASFDQLDLITEEIDRQLNEFEEEELAADDEGGAAPDEAS